MKANKYFEFCVIGGGLAGLSLAILLAKENKNVALFERNKYPKHKVCGEYISNESWEFLYELGLDLGSLNLPKINKLNISSPKGNLLQSELEMGGFGISRYEIDHLLFQLAEESGVKVFTDTKIIDIKNKETEFEITSKNETYSASWVFGTFGKRSNLDVNLNRDFIQQKHRGLDNYVAVKYHIKYDFPMDTIALHNFDNGYCGISNVEGGRCCLCYLTTAKNLEQSGNSIPEMEKRILHKNKYLKEIWENAEFMYDKPLAISQISFAKKDIEKDGIIMLGDAAGAIPPLSGNGMSIALHASKIMMDSLVEINFDNDKKAELLNIYSHKWNAMFKHRMIVGRLLQKFFGHPLLTEILLKITKPFPWLVNKLINATHGSKF